MSVSLRKPPSSPPPRRRETDQPLSLNRLRRWYESPRSFTSLLPWVDYDPETRTILLEDGRSLGALLELIPVPCEARPALYREELHRKVQTALVHALPEEDPPWVLQLFLQHEPVRQELMSQLRRAVEPVARNTPFTQQYLALWDQHLYQAEQVQGCFQDEAVAGRPWRVGVHRLRAVLYRRLPPRYRSPQGLTPAQELAVALARLSESLRAAGVQTRRLGGDDLHAWLVRWFNPAPAVPGQDTGTLVETLTFPTDPAERPFGADLAESLVLGMPVSDETEGVWWFDGRPTVAITLQRLLKIPQVGHLSAERSLGSRTASVWDRFPEGACLALTLIAQPQDAVLAHLERIERRAVGDGAEAARARQELIRARQELTRHNKLYPLNLVIYLQAESLPALRSREEELNALLLAEGLQPVSREHDLLRLDSFVRNLPMNFAPAFDRHTRWARLTYADHAARLLPAYGRSRGTGHPGILGFNRGGEPFTFDPLNRADRRKNAHTLIIGPPGSGKSSFLLATLTQQLALRRPRIFLTEVGRSFELFAEYLNRQGLTVNRVRLTPDDEVSLPPFVDAVQLPPAVLAGTVETAADAAVGDDSDDSDDSSDTGGGRDLLAELELAARLMVTGGEAREVERLHRADQRLLQRALLRAGRQARARVHATVLTEDVARALRTLPELDAARQTRAAEMADCLELYCEGFAGKVFNRPGHAWPDADVTILNLGLFANEGYEDKLALSVIGLVSHVNRLAERTRYEDRQIILCFDEAHLVTTHPLLAPYLTKASKVWGRRYAVWLWLATQNMDDFPPGARRMLNALEWWIALSMPPEEVEQLARFRDLTQEQRALLLAVRKEPGKYTEGVLLHDDLVALFRNVPPPLMLALAQTEQHERAERARLMREQQIDELAAAYEIARRIAAGRGVGG